MKKLEVVVVMGSRSDLSVMAEATHVLKAAGILVSTEILSAHRTPELLEKSVKLWQQKNIQLIIAGAGGAAHLPGMLASFSVLPVIGVPIKSAAMNGLDSLLSIAQMPKGIPVATVAVNNATNAALLALQILALVDKKLVTVVEREKARLNKAVLGDRKKLKISGVKSFLKSL